VPWRQSVEAVRLARIQSFTAIRLNWFSTHKKGVDSNGTDAFLISPTLV
jgi:hypothetical protein